MNNREKLAKLKLKNALLKLLAINSIYKITIKDICEEAQVNRSTFYKYYKNEFALLDELQLDATSKLKEKLYESSKSNENLLVGYLDFIRSNIDALEPLFFSESCTKFIDLFINDTYGMLQEMNVHSKYNSYVAEYIGNGGFKLILKWIDDGFELSTKEVADLIYAFSKNIVTNLTM